MKYTQILLAVSFALFISVGSPLSTSAQIESDRTQPASGDRGWPRKFASGGTSFAIYQPHVEEWVGNQFSARAAFAATKARINSHLTECFGLMRALKSTKLIAW